MVIPQKLNIVYLDQNLRKYQKFIHWKKSIMTNKELREKLEKLPDDTEVWSKIADMPIDDVYEQNHYDCGEWKSVIMLE